MSSLRPNISDPPRPNSPRPNSPRDNRNTLCTPLHHNSSTSPSSSTSPQSPTSPHTPLYHNSSTFPQTSTPRHNRNSHTEWSDWQTTALIEQWRERNYEYYYSIVGRSQRNFWNTIAESINRSCRCNYTGK